jgi:hypothetical protein
VHEGFGNIALLKNKFKKIEKYINIHSRQLPPGLIEFLATDPEVPGSIPGATRFSEK